ncbi:hypothetical protein PQQ59_06165 [Paraburkholderia aspalathi]|uniref:hypothetical protein n=1 Tax=Paraburkholderia aspalathi TaxID=1324617 RepID=UPI0038BD4024
MIDKNNLPAPRLQLRWAPSTLRHEYNWECHYELVLPLAKHDIRAEQEGSDGERLPPLKELVVPMKPPSLRNSEGTPCAAQDGGRYYDDPFRDGSHAWWDSKLLGNPPIFVIAPDGMAFARPDRDEDRDASPVASNHIGVVTEKVAAPAQSGEPVAWRYLTPTGWHATTKMDKALGAGAHHDMEPLYAAQQPAQTAQPVVTCKCRRLGDWKGFHHPLCDEAQPAQSEPALQAEIDRLNAIIHTPESDEFLKGAAIEAEYQRELHGVDASDARFDWHQWYWVVGYLAGKALAACKSGEGNGEKAKHHLVTSAALLMNWHNVLTGKPAANVHSNGCKAFADLVAALPASGDE